MASIETNNYLNALKSRKQKEITMATFSRTDLMKKQDGKCSRCKQDLKAGYYKFIKDPKSGSADIVCSDCFVHIPDRR